MTAVEWLVDQIKNVKIIDEYEWIKLQEAYNQAKEMEKQQITDAYRFGLQDEYVIGSQRYYNETFKSE